MSRNNRVLTTFLVASLAFLTATAFAGGPLLVDPNTKSAYHYDTSTPVPVYYDLGNLGVVTDYSTNPPNVVTFDNTVGKTLVTKGFGDWSGIKTSSLRANVVGDFSLIGLPDIDSTNITSIIGTSNGRGIYVVFDADGSIMQNFFGAGDGILGISSPQFAITGTTIITESFTVLNGSAMDPADPNGQNFQGVATHEFGHSLGMAHTQTNGAAYFYSYFNGEGVGPINCNNLPYSANLTSADVETMYPYINPYVGGTGMAQANIHTTDTIASFSDLYPGPGWSGSYGTITGKVYDIDGKTELTGVNVIARNIADPFVDSTSAVTGQMTQGLLGPDGSYTLHGLKPGAHYVVYVDAILAGGFPTPPLWFLPGAERFWDGNKPNPAFNPCQYIPITATRDRPTNANITFALTPGAPILHQLGYGAFVSALSGDGTVAVGGYGRGGPVFQWNAKQGVQAMNVAGVGGVVSISNNGRYISSNLLDVNSDTDLGAYRWDAKNGWLQVRPVGSCGTDTTWNQAVSNDGSVFGVAYNTCTEYKAFRWIPNTSIGTVEYPSSFKRSDGRWANSRIDQVSDDGSIAVGWQEAEWGGWLGSVWHNGKPELITDANGDSVSEAFTVSGDGSKIAGQLFDGQYPFDGSGWRRDTNSTTLEYVQPLNSDASPLNPYALSGDGSVMVGFSGNAFFSFQPLPFLWTKELGAVSLDDFVKNQGTAMEQWFSLWSPGAISADGTTIAGTGVGFQFYGGWVLDLHKAFVCHATGSGSGQRQTISVAFPKAFDTHLADGDTPGRCP
jgi:Matrixin